MSVLQSGRIPCFFPFHIALLLYHDSFFGFLRSGSTSKHWILGARSRFRSSANSLPCMGFWFPNRNAICVPPEHPPKMLQSVRCTCPDPKLHEHCKKYSLYLGQELKAPFFNDVSCHFNATEAGMCRFMPKEQWQMILWGVSGVFS